MNSFSEALWAYEKKFGDVDFITHPALMEKKELPQFIMDLVQTGKKATQQIVEERFGPISWDW